MRGRALSHNRGHPAGGGAGPQLNVGVSQHRPFVMHPLLQAAVDELYQAFARPRPSHVPGCECCADPQELNVLIQVPLRALTVAQLQPYAASAMTTVGDVTHFRYFWPRLAELVVALRPDEYLVDPEVLLGKPAYGHWRTWPVAEQRATEAYAAALLMRMRDEVLEPEEVDTWVCAVGQLVEDIRPLLDAALLARTPAARTNLRSFYHWNRRDFEKRRRLHNAFWRPSGADDHGPLLPSGERVVAWLAQPSVLSAVDEVYAAADSEDY